jgi:YggT family protein
MFGAKANTDKTGGFMQLIRLLSFIVSIYMVIIFFRIILTWFTWVGNSGLLDFLTRITDPYLRWFSQFQIFKAGFVDLSPIVALGVLSLVNRILITFSFYGKITLGIILALMLDAAWGAISFVLGFLILLLILRLIAHLLKRNNYNSFWRIVDTISRPVLFRINRILFKDRIVNFISSLIVSIAALGLIYLILRIIVFFVSGVLARLPI